MDDHFSELIVQRKPKPTDLLFKILLILATAVAAFFGLFVHPIFMIVLLLVGITDYFLFPRFNVEYEYTYVNGEIDIAAIYSKSSRKNLAQIDLENVECVAPYGSHHLDSYGITFKEVDYSSGYPEQKPYVIIKGGTNNQKILLHLDETMLEDLKWRLPGKVFRD